MKSLQLCRLLAVVGTLLWLAGPGAGDDTIIRLKKDFIEKYKRHVTIDTTLTVDKVGKTHTPSEDGDVHMAARAPEVELALVAEIKNVKDVTPTLDRAKQVAQDRTPVPVTGVWRFWCEHTSNKPHIQGDELSRFHTSNPSHVFELHPVVKFDGASLLDTIKGIDGYKYKDATRAFLQYENTMCRLKDNGDTVTIRTRQAGYNHVEFILQSVDDEIGGLKVDDGRFMFASVRDLDGELLVRKVRMAFVKDTAAEKVARNLKHGDRVRVVALPRISLSLISWRIANANKPEWKDFDVLEWHLPYEMIVIATTGEVTQGDDD
jgi:hypothetical protein